eukprot:TRINITY_DN67520_c0_g1_i1.p1 TRINITY_DN67520_c0_g1~~TRINITY_DN67520_c0_g1_i1.p1  ORF type:complete len:358 (+),score=50.79 TRINITY_DN67520_c0_g1_i1:46-1074(+)
MVGHRRARRGRRRRRRRRWSGDVAVAATLFLTGGPSATAESQESRDAAAELAWWHRMMKPWNRTKRRSIGHNTLLPVSTPNVAGCNQGALRLVTGHPNSKWRSRRAKSLEEEGYAMCPQPSLLREGCVIYSCGIDEDLAFEVSMAQNTKCQVFAFDPSPTARRWMAYLLATADPPTPYNLHYLPWGWSDQDTVVGVDPWDDELTGNCPNCFWPWNSEEWGQPSSRWTVLRPGTIARRLNHTRVDLVKMDCEGAEYAHGVVEELLALNPEQFLLEQHPEMQMVLDGTLTRRRVTSPQWTRIQDLLWRHGLRQVWTGRDKPRRREYSFVDRKLTTLHVPSIPGR